MVMDYEGRLSRVREAMQEEGIALLYLRRGANLSYLTGIKRRGPELTDSNSYGDIIHGAYITLKGGITLVAPRMGGEGWKRQADGKPWITKVRIVRESERPKEVLREVLGGLNMRGKGVAIEGRAWANTVILFRQVTPYSKISDACELIEPMRMIKDDDEVKAMRRAAEVTDKVYGKVVEDLSRGMTEVDVANIIDYEFRKLGADYNSFVTGVRFRSPEHPWVLGESAEERVLEDGDSISFDFGCVLDGYCSDFGRTVFVGEPPSKMREIHDIVITAQRTAIEKMVEGELTCEQLDSVARGIIERGGFGSNFVHRLGHGIGLTVHEAPYLYIPDDTLLRAGMTFTVEPSVLLFGEWSARVEDVVLVTGDGGESLNRFSRELTVI